MTRFGGREASQGWYGASQKRRSFVSEHSGAAPSVRGLFVGLSVLDLVLEVPHPVAADQKVRALGQELSAGGPATNAAVVFAALGGEASLLTTVGRHPLAEVIRADLAAHGVDLLDATPDDPESPVVAAIAVERATGGRQVVSAHGRRDPSTPPGIEARLQGRGVVLLDGHHPRMAEAVARAARQAGIPVLLDAGSWKPHLAGLLPWVDLAIASADFLPPDVAPDAVLDWLHAAGVPAAAVTAGPAPVRWSVRGSGAGEVAPPRVRAVDTLGAGDVFHGAAAWALCREGGLTTLPQRLPEILQFACGVAAERVQVAGARAWVQVVGARSARKCARNGGPNT